jgi:hypothetical protein
MECEVLTNVYSQSNHDQAIPDADNNDASCLDDNPFEMELGHFYMVK